MDREIINFKKKGIPIAIYNLKLQKGGTYRDMHSHASIEIIEVISGVLSCDINGKTVNINANQTILINSNIGHKLYADDAEISYMHIDAASYKETTNLGEFENLYEFILYRKLKPYLTFNKNPEISDILHKIKTRYYENQENSLWYLKAHIYELIAFMYSNNFIAPLIPFNKQTEKIEAIVRYVNENFKFPITLDEICSQINYNKYTLCHNFKSVTDATIFEYINFLRIHYAVEKLSKNENSISEIATECGFSSSAYFNRVFKNIFGCSPSVYRKLLTENIIN